MANATFTVDAPAVALVATTAKTLLMVTTPATSDAEFDRVAIGCDVTSAGTLKVELISWASNGGTATAYTPKASNAPAHVRAAFSSAFIAFTAEPTGAATVLETWNFVLPLGHMHLMLPLDEEKYIPVSSFYGFRFTSSVAGNGYCTAQVKE